MHNSHARTGSLSTSMANRKDPLGRALEKLMVLSTKEKPPEVAVKLSWGIEGEG